MIIINIDSPLAGFLIVIENIDRAIGNYFPLPTYRLVLQNTSATCLTSHHQIYITREKTKISSPEAHQEKPTNEQYIVFIINDKTFIFIDNQFYYAFNILC